MWPAGFAGARLRRENVTEIATDGNGTPATEERAGVRHLWPVVVGVGIVLAGFDFWSAGFKSAHKSINSVKPPIYGGYAPMFPSRAWIAIGVGVAAVAVFFVLSRWERIHAAIFVPIVAAFSFGFAMALGFIRAAGAGPYAALLRISDYHGDTVLARTIGFGTFIKKFPTLVPELTSVHSRTHPPGPVVFLAFLERLFPKSVAPRAFVVAGISALIVIPAWFIAERIGGRRAAIIAVCVLGLSPAIAMFTFTSMDAVFATALAVVGALLIYGITRGGNVWLAFAGGVAAGLAAFMTYAVIFVVIATVIAALLSLPVKRALTVLAYAAVGGVVAVALLRVAIGWDLIASYRQLRQATGGEGRSYAYWVFGNLAAWLSFTGIPIVALALVSFRRTKSVLYVAALVVPLVIFSVLPASLTRLAPGETERTWLFTQPFLAAAAGAAFVAWERTKGARKPSAVLILLVLAAGQTIAMQMLFNTLW
jgi:hypothetical protein